MEKAKLQIESSSLSKLNSWERFPSSSSACPDSNHARGATDGGDCGFEKPGYALNHQVPGFVKNPSDDESSAASLSSWAVEEGLSLASFSSEAAGLLKSFPKRLICVAVMSAWPLVDVASVAISQPDVLSSLLAYLVPTAISQAMIFSWSQALDYLACQSIGSAQQTMWIQVALVWSMLYVLPSFIPLAIGIAFVRGIPSSKSGQLSEEPGSVLDVSAVDDALLLFSITCVATWMCELSCAFLHAAKGMRSVVLSCQAVGSLGHLVGAVYMLPKYGMKSLPLAACGGRLLAGTIAAVWNILYGISAGPPGCPAISPQRAMILFKKGLPSLMFHVVVDCPFLVILALPLWTGRSTTCKDCAHSLLLVFVSLHVCQMVSSAISITVSSRMCNHLCSDMPDHAKACSFVGTFLATILSCMLGLSVWLIVTEEDSLPDLAKVWIALLAIQEGICVLWGSLLAAQGRQAVVLGSSLLATSCIVVPLTSLWVTGNGVSADQSIRGVCRAIFLGGCAQALMLGAVLFSSQWEEQGLLAVHRRWGVLGASSSFGHDSAVISWEEEPLLNDDPT